VKRKNHTGSDQDSSLKEAGCLIFFTSVLFLMMIGYPSILNSSQPQQVFAEPSPIDFYNYNPTINTAFLVSPQTVFPNYDPFYQWVQDYQDYMINKILPSAEAVHVTPTTPTPDFFDDFTTDKGWSFNGTDVIDIFTATGSINITTLGTGAGSPPNFRTMGSLDIDSLISGGWNPDTWSIRTIIELNATTNQGRFTLVGVSENDQTFMSGTSTAQNCNSSGNLVQDQGCFSFFGSPTNHWVQSSRNSTLHNNINVNLTEPYTLNTKIYPEVIYDGNFIRYTVYSDAGYQHVLGCTNDKFDPSTGDCTFEAGNRGVSSQALDLDGFAGQAVRWDNLKHIWFGTASGIASDFVGTTGAILEVSFWNLNITASEGNLPAQVTGLNIIQNLSPWAFMTWDDVPEADSYNIYWKHHINQVEFKRIATVTDNKFTDKRLPYDSSSCLSNNALCSVYKINAVNATGEGLNSTDFRFGLVIPTSGASVEPFVSDPTVIIYRQRVWVSQGSTFTGIENLANSVYYRIGSNVTDIHIASSSANDGTFATTGNEIFGQKVTVPDMNLTRIIQKFDFNSAFPTAGNVTAFVWNSTDGFIDLSNDTIHFPVSADIKDVTTCEVTSCDSVRDQDFLFPTQVPLSAGEYVFGLRFEDVSSTGTHGQGVISSGSDSGVRVSDSDWTNGITFVEDVGADSNIQVIGIADNWQLCTAGMSADDDDFGCPVGTGNIPENVEVWIQSFATTNDFPFNDGGNSGFGRSAIVPISSFSTNELGIQTGGLINFSGYSAGSTAFFAIPATPEAPTGLAVIQDMADEAELDWDDQSDADSYLVFRAPTNTSTSNVNINGTWYFREQDAGIFTLPVCSFTVLDSGSIGHLKIAEGDSGGRQPFCSVFKTFPRDFLNGSRIQVNMETVHSSSSFLLSVDGFVTTMDDPNQYERDDDTEFKQFKRNFAVEAGVIIDKIDEVSLTIAGGRITEEFVGFESDWDTPDTDYATISITQKDTNALTQSLGTKIFWINITDFDTGDPKAFYNFSGGNRVKERDTLCTNDSDCSC